MDRRARQPDADLIGCELWRCSLFEPQHSRRFSEFVMDDSSHIYFHRQGVPHCEVCLAHFCRLAAVEYNLLAKLAGAVLKQGLNPCAHVRAVKQRRSNLVNHRIGLANSAVQIQPSSADSV